MTTIDNYTYFYKDKIAQWNMSAFKDLQEVFYNCAEQYMMAQKAKLFEDQESYEKIMRSNNPREQQEIGREIKNFNQEIWDAHAQIIVYQGNYFKFTQNKHLYSILKSTGNTILVEASPIDKIWGVGLDINNPLILDKKNWLGKNLLGYTLTFLRDNI